MSVEETASRVERLEKRVRVLTLVAAALLMALLLVVVQGSGPATQDVLRVNGLVVVDEEGRERIVLGAPIPEPEWRRVAPSTGIVINDENGAERFGVGLLGNGNLVMGFDAPPGTGSELNRERLSFIANSKGGASLRFLNRGARVAAHMELFSDDNVRLFFTEYLESGTRVHRLSAEGDTVVVRSR